MTTTRFRQYNYAQARESWGQSVADAIWRSFPRSETQSRATLAEDQRLVGQPSANQVRSIIDSIVERSTGTQR